MSKRILASFLGVVVILLANALVAQSNVWTLVANNVLVVHTQEVQREIASLLAALAELETSQRGFVLTGDEQFLEPFLRDEQSLKRCLQRLHKLTSDNESQQQ